MIRFRQTSMRKTTIPVFFLHINLLKTSCGKAGNCIFETLNLRIFWGSIPKTHPRLGRLQHTSVLSTCVHLHNLTQGSWYEVLSFQVAVTKMIVGLLADGNNNYIAEYSGGSCSGMSQTQLGKGCSISDDCSTITCNMNFVDEPITFKLKV